MKKQKMDKKIKNSKKNEIKDITLHIKILRNAVVGSAAGDTPPPT